MPLNFYFTPRPARTLFITRTARGLIRPPGVLAVVQILRSRFMFFLGVLIVKSSLGTLEEHFAYNSLSEEDKKITSFSTFWRIDNILCHLLWRI